MNKKILIGSIIAVVILVLVSLTGVVGFQTTSSTIARASPLFSVRSSRAIDEESKDIACDYVGKGEAVSFPLPILNSRNKLFQKGLDIIKGMDEKSFNIFVEMARNRLHNDKEIENIDEIVMALHQLRTNPEKVKHDSIYMIEGYTFGNWVPFCGVFTMFLALIGIFIVIYRALLNTSGGHYPCETMECLN